MHDFGERLRRLMAQQNVGVRELARRSYFNPGHMSRVVNGHTKPTRELAERLDEALGAEGQLAAHAPPALDNDEDRLLYAARHPRRIDRAAVGDLAAVLAHNRRLEDTIGSTSLLAPTVEQLRTIEQLANEARGDIRPHVVDVAAQWAQFAGWLHTSTNQPMKACAWFDRAAEWAEEAENATMPATILSFKGHLAWQAGRVGPMIGLSQAAQRRRNVSAGQRAFDAGQEARGHAMVGDGDATDRKLDEAVTLGAHAGERPEDEPPWIYYYTPAFFVIQRGLAYRYLGRDDPHRNQQAITLLTRGLDALGEDRRAEWSADYVSRLATCYMQAGDPEQAAATITEIDDIARATRSERLSKEAYGLHARLMRAWPKVAAVVELGERLRNT